uniref:Uncharacterized protein n=1 Tax=Arundo donax TaxID=35708 RepID=A0A0A9BZH9_ARUDO
MHKQPSVFITENKVQHRTGTSNLDKT